MNDKRFEAWWASNPARATLDTAAKEVARNVWRAAQRDMATELLEMVTELLGINPASAGASFDALIASLHTNPEYDRRGGDLLVPPLSVPVDTHAELRKTWAPGQKWQTRMLAGGEWRFINGTPGWHANQEYRRCE